MLLRNSRVHLEDQLPPVTVALPRCDSLGVDTKLQGACDQHAPKGPCAVIGEVEPPAGVIQSNFWVFHEKDFCAGVLGFPFIVHPLEEGQKGGVDRECELLGGRFANDGDLWKS